MTHELRTNSLILCPLKPVDATSLHALWTDEAVRRFLWDGEIIPLEQTRQIVRQSQALFDESGFGLWRICDRNSHRAPPEEQDASNKLLGFAGFWYFRTPPSLELLFGVAPESWGQGIAAEAGQRLIHYGFEDLGFDGVEASTDVANKSSIRVLEKLGLSLQKRAVVEGLDTLFYHKSRP